MRRQSQATRLFFAALRRGGIVVVVAAFLLLFSPSSLVPAVSALDLEELHNEAGIYANSIEDTLRFKLGPTKAEFLASGAHESDEIPDLPAYGLPGPCGQSPVVVRSRIVVNFPDIEELSKEKNVTLKTTITVPGKASCNGRTAPWPVVFMYAGFSVPSWGYTRYAEHLASWGYAAVQYDPDPYSFTFSPRGIESELFVDPVIEWALGPGSAMAGTTLDTRRMAATGHSLGGKESILALGYGKTGSKRAGPTNITAAFVLDAVDLRIVSRDSPFFYSNMKEVMENNITVPIGAMAQPLRDRCTPPGHSYDIVFPAARPGSWLFLFYKTSHASFPSAAKQDEFGDKAVFEFGTITCGGVGLSSRVASVKYALAAMTAWFDGGNVGDPGKAAGGIQDANTPALQQQFLSWAQDPAQQHWVWFGIKK